MKKVMLTLVLILTPININAVGIDDMEITPISISNYTEDNDFSVQGMLNNNYVPWETLPSSQVEYKEYIYFKESSFGYLPVEDSIHMENEDSGAYGICQIVPGDDKLYVYGYGDVVNDVNSQDFLCTRYMHDIYGDWETAYEFWANNESW